MSKIKNEGGFRPGSIYRIALENFVTYKQVVLFPGPALNMIIGPNGTGKSTFVCAIILGLCGKTNVIGRAKKISEYVRSGCEEATIEIELYQRAGERNVIITRHFNTEDISTWHIDNKAVREKQVQDLIAALNIQVDNLCQLLPQDRVQDFSKLDAQQLLRSTLAAVGGQRSVQQLDELIETRNQQRGLSTTIQNNAQLLQEQERLNERLKIVIDAMKQRKEIEKQIEICEKKKLWLEYQELREKVIEYTNDKKQAMKLVASHRTKVEPLEKVIEKARTDITKLEQQKLAASRETHTLREQAHELLKSVREQEYSIADAHAAYTEQVERHRNREQELVEARTRLDKLNTDKEKLQETLGDETRVKMEMAEIVRELSKCKASLDALNKQRLDVQYQLENNITPQIRLYQNKLRALQDVNAKRLETLRSYSEDAYKAVLWLRENRALFTQPVYEPMMLEINFTDPKFARYLEATVSSRDLVAFTFECSGDMNLFLERARRGLGLRRVNALCSPPAPLPHPPPIQHISYLGFYTYLCETLSAPEAVSRYLRAQYAVHRLPIGTHHTYTHSHSVPDNITHYFTENHRFIVRVSAYSGARSSSTVELRPARLLANTTDTEQLDACTKQLREMESRAESHRRKLSALDDQIAAVEGALDQHNNNRKHINDRLEKMRTLSAQIRLQCAKVREIETEPALDERRARAACAAAQARAVAAQCTAHARLVRVCKQLHTAQDNTRVYQAKLEFSRNAIVEQESELRELKSELRNVQATLENVENMLTRAKSSAKEKLVEAKRSCDNKLPQDPDFPYKEDFEVLPSEASALHHHCLELHTRMECMDQGDEQVVKEYEEREKSIARLRRKVHCSSDTNKELQEKMDQIRAEWLPPLERLLRDINSRFGDMFARLGCAGEVKLDRAGGECDYDKYGVCVLVSFRAGEALQALTRHAQSGGERALATALYLLALQALTTVPFRCVDEINQGMDAVNERKLFQLLVQVVTHCDSAQYFLLTPKLLPKLEYNSKITVHTIYNGRSVMNYRHWKYPHFLERAHTYTHRLH